VCTYLVAAGVAAVVCVPPPLRHPTCILRQRGNRLEKAGRSRLCNAPAFLLLLHHHPSLRSVVELHFVNLLPLFVSYLTAISANYVLLTLWNPNMRILAFTVLVYSSVSASAEESPKMQPATCNLWALFRAGTHENVDHVFHGLYLRFISTNNIARGMVRGSQLRFQSTKSTLSTSPKPKRFIFALSSLFFENFNCKGSLNCFHRRSSTIAGLREAAAQKRPSS
jgi:hypothetical protein